MTEEDVVDYVSGDSGLDPDMALCANLRAAGIFIHATNREEFGHLIRTEGYQTHHTHNELWEMATNRYDWQARYLHPSYKAVLGSNEAPDQPCPDVYWFPIVTHRFADELVSECENYGKWSDGSNNVS